jgi:DNA replication protein DnaC
MERLLARSNVPEKYRQVSWERCRADAPLREYARSIGDRLTRGDGLLIFGPVGTGKSSAAGLLCQAALRQGWSCRWEYVPTLRDYLATRDEKLAALRKNEAADLLVWDDFGVGGLADWEVGWLDQIVESRYSRRRSMIVTTNLTRADLQGDPLLARIVDRWRERTQAVTISGESMRGHG